MRTTGLLVALLLFTAPAMGEDGFSLKKESFPAAWKMTRSYVMEKNHLPAVSQRLGGRITGLQNIVLNAGGIRLQVNLLDCADRTQAAAVWKRILSFRKDPLYVAFRGEQVIEFVSKNPLVVKKARHCLSLSSSSLVWWSVTLTLAPIQSGDYTHLNPLFNLLLRHSTGTENEALRSRIVEEARHFRFTDTLRLYTLPVKEHAAVFTCLSPLKAVKIRGSTTAYTFEALPRSLGIPQVIVQGRIPVEAFGSRKADDPYGAQRLVGATKAWPVDDRRIAHALSGLLREHAKTPPSQRVDAILSWIHRQLRYGGPMGTRLGVMEALKAGTGRCWDFSDVFITLCRAIGVPARQVYGWFGKSGHVWAEVLIGERWLPVDPTTTWKGVSEDYLPFAVSEEGIMPILYWKMPLLKRE